jgi:hypothetical protein
VTKQERIATLVTIRVLVESLMKAEAGDDSEVAACCADPLPKNFGTFAGEDWRCQNCGRELGKDVLA